MGNQSLFLISLDVWKINMITAKLTFLHLFLLEKGNRTGIAEKRRSHERKQKKENSSDYSEAFLVYYILNNYFDVYSDCVYCHLCQSILSHPYQTRGSRYVPSWVHLYMYVK